MAGRMLRLRVEISEGSGPPLGGFEVVYSSEEAARGALARLKSQLLGAGQEVYELGRSTQDTRVLRLMEKLKKDKP